MIEIGGFPASVYPVSSAFIFSHYSRNWRGCKNLVRPQAGACAKGKLIRRGIPGAGADERKRDDIPQSGVISYDDIQTSPAIIRASVGEIVKRGH